MHDGVLHVGGGLVLGSDAHHPVPVGERHASSVQNKSTKNLLQAQQKHNLAIVILICIKT